MLINSIVVCESACLAKIATSLNYLDPKSAYQRTRRFLKDVVFCQIALAKMIVNISGMDKHLKWIVVLDRTNWKFGKVNINFLYMSVSYGEFCIPLFFKLLTDKSKGNSSFSDRRELSDLFIQAFGRSKILYMLGDREFIGNQWLSYLKGNKIAFAQRIREKNQLLINKRGQTQIAHKLFEHLPIGQTLCVGRYTIGQDKKIKLRLMVTGMKIKDGDDVCYVIVVSHGVDNPLDVYRNRWQIEMCFRALTSSGFNAESTHVTIAERLTCLFSVLIIVYAVTINIGLQVIKLQPIRIKNHGYKEKCLIRYTLDAIKPLLSGKYLITRKTKLKTELELILENIGLIRGF